MRTGSSWPGTPSGSNPSNGRQNGRFYFKIFRKYHPQDSILGSIGIWTGFDFAEEREKVRGTVDGDRKHVLI